MNAYPSSAAGPAMPPRYGSAQGNNASVESEHPLSPHAAANILLGLRQVVLHGARNGPSSSVPAPAPLASSIMRFAVPLLPDTDPSFKIDITVGGVPGFQMVSEKWRPSDDVRDSAVALTVDGAATMSLDGLFPSPEYLNVHRGIFWHEMANIQPKLRSWTRKSPPTGFTLAHLLLLLVQKQRTNWHMHSSESGAAVARIDVQKLVGADVCPWRGIMASVSSLYVVAIRRHVRPECGSTWYFPQLEVRVCVQ